MEIVIKNSCLIPFHNGKIYVDTSDKNIVLFLTKPKNTMENKLTISKLFENKHHIILTTQEDCFESDFLVFGVDKNHKNKKGKNNQVELVFENGFWFCKK
jgi:hypothetical protein